MSNPSKAKGSAFEREVVKLFNAHGLSAKRTPLSGALADWPGDVILDGFAVECKRVEKLRIWQALDQVLASSRGGREPLLIFRRSARPNERPQVWATVRAECFAGMLAELADRKVAAA